MSQTKFYEAYSRWDDDKERYETWDEAVTRVMDMHRNFYSNKMTPELDQLINEAESYYKLQYVLGAQRALQFGGDQIMKHMMRMYNCTSSYADRPRFFSELFYVLLCGAGAGFSVQEHHVAKMPNVAERKKQAKGWVVEDSIEGWADALGALMSSYFVGGGQFPEMEGRKIYFDLNQIRPKGAMISGGFKAPGPEPLRKSLDKIEHLIQSRVLKGETRLRPIDVYDIAMHAADAVLAGGVRRSATICLFSADDEEMVNAKTGNWFVDNPQRGRSNNSAVIVRDEVTKEDFKRIMQSIKEFGEPGFYFVDDRDFTTNPCVEIGMYPQIDGESGWQGCNLTEINGGKCTTEAEFFKACRAGAILGTLQAGYTDFKYLSGTSKQSLNVKRS
jgi:ribonucleoside-diphosphate reductase alpha chain